MNKHTPGPWYAGLAGSQGLICQEETGKSIAVSYNLDDARLIAAAPDLLAALQPLVDAADTEPGMAIYKAHIEQARQAIARATE